MTIQERIIKNSGVHTRVADGRITILPNGQRLVELDKKNKHAVFQGLGARVTIRGER